MPSTVVANRSPANGPCRRACRCAGPSPLVASPHENTNAPSDASPRALRPQERLLAAVSLLVLFVLLVAGFARLAGLAGLDETPGSPPPSIPVAPVDPSAAASPAPPATASGGSAASPSSIPSSVPLPTVPSSTPGASRSPTTDLPPRWPVSLPDPGQHVLLGLEGDGEDRWLLAVPGNANLSGGRFIAGLEELDWDVSAVATGKTATAVGVRGQERVAVSIRPGGDLTPENWVLLEVVYQPTIPDFEVPPTSTLPPEEEAAKRS